MDNKLFVLLDDYTTKVDECFNLVEALLKFSTNETATSALANELVITAEIAQESFLALQEFGITSKDEARRIYLKEKNRRENEN